LRREFISKAIAGGGLVLGLRRREAKASPATRGESLSSTLGSLDSALIGCCHRTGCIGDSRFSVTALGEVYGPNKTVGQVLPRLRCPGPCKGRYSVVWLQTASGRVLLRGPGV
jgi:hypothetical protein